MIRHELKTIVRTPSPGMPRSGSADERRAAVRRVFLLTLGLNAAVAMAKAGYG